MSGMRSATAPRFEKYKRPRISHALAVVGVASLVALGPLSAAASPASRAASAHEAAEWIAGQQTSTGAFIAEDLRVDLHAEALAAVVAGVVGATTIEDALDYMESNGEAGATEGARTGRIIAGIVAGGEDPEDFGGVDYVAILASQLDSTQGRYRKDATATYTDLFSNLLAANGDIAADGQLPESVKDYILGQKCPDGGYAFGGVGDCAFNDVDTTALAVNALANSGLTGADVDDALDEARTYLLGAQNPDGGFTFCCAGGTSSDSTGLALAAIAALGEDAESHPWMQADGDDPVQALESLQTSEGSFRFADEDFNGDPITEGNTLSTVNAIPGMAGESYPIQAAEPGPDPDPTPTPTPTVSPAGDNDEQDDGETEVGGVVITLPDTGGDPGPQPVSRAATLWTAIGLACVGLGARLRRQAR
ncbi:MAG: prenyltransferase/squalene oxidase repeat-containing protein [Actinomycetota bacterium]